MQWIQKNTWPMEFEQWIQSMLPEYNVQARRLPWILGGLSLCLGFVFSRVEFPQWSMTPSLDTGKVEIVTHLNTRPPLIPVPEKIPPAHNGRAPASKGGSAPGAGDQAPAGKHGGPSATAQKSPHASPSRGVLKEILSVERRIQQQLNTTLHSDQVLQLSKALKDLHMVGSRPSALSGAPRGKSDLGSDGPGMGFLGQGTGSGPGKGTRPGIPGGLGGTGGNYAGIGGPSHELGAGKHLSLGVSTPMPKELEILDGGAGRSKSEIMNVVRARTPGLRYILNKFTRTGDFNGGVLTLKMNIAASGEILSVQVVRSSGLAAFDQEIVDKVKQWNFGALPGSGQTQLTVPFQFSS